mmetsp:Transcript_30452/g.61987  ORF Transcript_30452/g.61987 Transcript_30452/m.61987 type:complete len:462 (+) Transcript_30452:123-1508(+)
MSTSSILRMCNANRKQRPTTSAASAAHSSAVRFRTTGAPFALEFDSPFELNLPHSPSKNNKEGGVSSILSLCGSRHSFNQPEMSSLEFRSPPLIDRLTSTINQNSHDKILRAPSDESNSPEESKFVGVQWDEQKGKWRAQVSCGRTFLGYHDSEEAAARTYDEKACQLGRKVNFPEDGQAQATKEREQSVSKFVGVRWHKKKGKWSARIKQFGSILGYYESEEEAARVYDERAIELHRHLLNFPPSEQIRATPVLDSEHGQVADAGAARAGETNDDALYAQVGESVEAGEWESALLKLVSIEQSEGVLPPAWLVEDVVRLCEENGEWERASNILNSADARAITHEEGIPLAKSSAYLQKTLSPDEKAFNVALKGCARLKRGDKALGLLDAMVEVGVPIDADAYRLAAEAQDGRRQKVARLLLKKAQACGGFVDASPNHGPNAGLRRDRRRFPKKKWESQSK